MQNIKRWYCLPCVLMMGLLGYIFSIQQLTIAQDETMSDLPVLSEAPELHDGIWLNTEVPLKLEALRGQVVLLKMWTFGCINCIRTLPYLSEWHENYKDEGLVIIGNHYPEFNYERDLVNLRDAIIRLEVDYPVLQDNERDTWGRYHNRYWPTVYLIDKQGNVRYKHIGEGRYDETEEAILELLAEPYVQPEDEAITIDTEADDLLIHSLTPTEPLNVRSGAGISFNKIGIIFPNEAYYILGEENDWYQILFDGATAYVSAEYVSTHDIQSGEMISLEEES